MIKFVDVVEGLVYLWAEFGINQSVITILFLCRKSEMVTQNGTFWDDSGHFGDIT